MSIKLILISVLILASVFSQCYLGAPIDIGDFLGQSINSGGDLVNDIDSLIDQLLDRSPFDNVPSARLNNNNGIITSAPIQISTPISIDRFTRDGSSTMPPPRGDIGMFYGMRTVRPRRIQQSDFVRSDAEYERMLSDLFEQSRQEALDQKTNQYLDVDPYVVDTDSDAIDRMEVAKHLTPDCAICLESYEPYEMRNSLACGHTFHKNCIKTWLHTSLSCPVCRVNATIIGAHGH